MTLKEKFKNLSNEHSILKDEFSELSRVNQRMLKKHLELQGDHLRALEEMRRLARKCLHAERKYVELAQRYSDFLDNLADVEKEKTPERKETWNSSLQPGPIPAS